MSSDQKTQDASYTGNTLPVTVSVVRGKTVMVSQVICGYNNSLLHHSLLLRFENNRGHFSLQNIIKMIVLTIIIK